jgi:MFS family permease
MPLSIGLSIVGIAAGVLLTKLGRYRVVLTLGWLAVILGNGILILLDASIPSMYWIPIFIIVGSSHGPLMISHIVSIQASAHRDNVGYAASIYTFMRSLGQCVGVAVGATVFQNTLSHHLSDLSLPISVASNAEAFVSVLKQMPLDSEERQLYVLAYSQSFRNLFEVLTGFSVLGFFVCLLIREYSMDRGLESAHVLQTRVEKRQEYM